MLNLRSDKGAITLFVLVSCLFFIASVVCVQMYMQSKQTAVDREYRQIKASYEQSVDENAISDAYRQVVQLNDISIVVDNISKVGNKLTVQFTLDTTNVTNLDIKTIKYGWGTGTEANAETVTDWTYLESESINSKMIAINNNASSSGDYYLVVVVNNQELYETITV